MYFWNIKELTNELKDKTVSEKEKMKYLIFFSTAGISFSTPSSETIDFIFPGLFPIFELIILSIINILGIYWCYYQNKIADGKDFLTRTICLGVPVMTKVFIFFSLVYTLFQLKFFMFLLESDLFLSRSFNPILLMVYYFVLGKKINTGFRQKNN